MLRGEISVPSNIVDFFQPQRKSPQGGEVTFYDGKQAQTFKISLTPNKKTLRLHAFLKSRDPREGGWISLKLERGKRELVYHEKDSERAQILSDEMNKYLPAKNPKGKPSHRPKRSRESANDISLPSNSKRRHLVPNVFNATKEPVKKKLTMATKRAKSKAAAVAGASPGDNSAPIKGAGVLKKTDLPTEKAPAPMKTAGQQNSLDLIASAICSRSVSSDELPYYIVDLLMAIEDLNVIPEPILNGYTIFLQSIDNTSRLAFHAARLAAWSTHAAWSKIEHFMTESM